MRIEGPRPSEGVKKSDKTRKSGGASGDFKTFMGGDADAPDAARGPGGIGGVGSLLAAQSVEDPTERKARKRMMDRAGKVLDALAGVHTGLLNGTLSTAQMQDVTSSVGAAREKVSDPRLAGLLDEVDLRAQVELAKMDMAKQKKS